MKVKVKHDVISLALFISEKESIYIDIILESILISLLSFLDLCTILSWSLNPRGVDSAYERGGDARRLA